MAPAGSAAPRRVAATMHKRDRRPLVPAQHVKCSAIASEHIGSYIDRDLPVVEYHLVQKSEQSTAKFHTG